MGNKYYQDKEDRRHESRGMKKSMHKDRDSHGGYGSHERFVTGHDPDIGRDSHSGMPDEKVMSTYPKSRSMRGGYLDDTMTDIDDVQNQAEKTTSSHVSNQK